LFTNPKDYAGSFCIFLDEMAKIDISYQISQQMLDRTSRTFQHWYSHMHGDYKTDINVAVGLCYGNQLQFIFGPFLQTSKLTAFTHALTFRNKIQYRFVNACINKRGTNVTTSCENVVKISSVTLEFKKGVCGIFLQKLGKKLGKNWHISPNISTTAGLIFTELLALVACV